MEKEMNIELCKKCGKLMHFVEPVVDEIDTNKISEKKVGDADYRCPNKECENYGLVVHCKWPY